MSPLAALALPQDFDDEVQGLGLQGVGVPGLQGFRIRVRAFKADCVAAACSSNSEDLDSLGWSPGNRKRMVPN